MPQRACCRAVKNHMGTPTTYAKTSMCCSSRNLVSQISAAARTSGGLRGRPHCAVIAAVSSTTCTSYLSISSPFKPLLFSSHSQTFSQTRVASLDALQVGPQSGRYSTKETAALTLYRTSSRTTEL